MKSYEVNYNLLGFKNRAWLWNMSKFAFAHLVNSGSVQQTLKVVADEITKSRIVRDVNKRGLLGGYITLPQYDEEKGRIEFRARATGGSGTYLLMADGFYVNGKQRLFDSLNWRYAKCEQLRDVVRLHNPALAKKLDGHRPA